MRAESDKLETTFFDTLIDENAATHIALGNAYDHPVEDPDDKKRINASRVHIDFMIGSPEARGRRHHRRRDIVPVLRKAPGRSDDWVWLQPDLRL